MSAGRAGEHDRASHLYANQLGSKGPICAPAYNGLSTSNPAAARRGGPRRVPGPRLQAERPCAGCGSQRRSARQTRSRRWAPGARGPRRNGSRGSPSPRQCGVLSCNGCQWRRKLRNSCAASGFHRRYRESLPAASRLFMPGLPGRKHEEQSDEDQSRHSSGVLRRVEEK